MNTGHITDKYQITIITGKDISASIFVKSSELRPELKRLLRDNFKEARYVIVSGPSIKIEADGFALDWVERAIDLLYGETVSLSDGLSFWQH